MANTLVELNDVLFNELRRLRETEAKGEELKDELRRVNTITQVAKTIVQNADVLLRAQVVDSERLACCQSLPSMLQIDTKESKK